jgi:hypothetical protein
VLAEDPQPVIGNIPCAACGYDLAGLAPEGVCPECTHPIAKSLEAPLLRFADPAWLERTTEGLRLHAASMRWLVIAAGFFLGAFLVLGLVMVALGLRDGGGGRFGVVAPDIVKCEFVLAAALVPAAGVFQFGTPPTNLAGPRVRRWAFRTLRVCALLHLAGAVFGVVAQVEPWHWSHATRVALGALFQLNGVALLAAYLGVLQDLERRTFAWSPASVTRSVAGAAIVVLGALWMIASRLGAGDGGWGGGIVTLILMAFTWQLGYVKRAVEAELAAARGCRQPQACDHATGPEETVAPVP